MGVTANTGITYGNLVIKDDLQEQYVMVSPEETPFQTIAGVGESATQSYKEWTKVALAAPVTTNRVLEGEADPPNDAATAANRLGNYCQISDKIVMVSHTAEATDAAANNIQQLSKQMALKIRELKRDMEMMLLQNVAANAGAEAVARVAAGFPTFLRTNVVAESGGTNPTLSGTSNGFPNAIANVGDVPTPVPLTEAKFQEAIRLAWNAGGRPDQALVNDRNKTVISSTFKGNATRYKDAIDKKLVAAIDLYDSDFGVVEVIPTRFLPNLNLGGANDNTPVYLIDDEYVSLSFLETMRQKPLAETGHAKRRLVWAEYTLIVEAEDAHAIIRDTNGLAPTP